jgi:hypothetical protein
MQTVVETAAYLAAAAEAGVTPVEAKMIVDRLAADPTAGDVIQGTGGCRKVRMTRTGKGKSGGYRVITFFTGPDIPLCLLTNFAKADRSDVSGKERNALQGLTKALAEAYRKPRRSRGR